MAFATNAPARFKELDSKRSTLLRRCERYASYTLPKVCPVDNYNQNSEELTQDFQAVGAQAVNNLVNKMMLALFAPSRPFFRLDASPKAQQTIAAAGAPPDAIQTILAQAEKSAVEQLDRRALRPKLFEALKHIVITGNTLLMFEKSAMRVAGIKSFVVRRSMSGLLLELIIADKVMIDELDAETRVLAQRNAGAQEDKEVTLYRWIKYVDGEYQMTQWVDAYQLPEKFNGKWSPDNCPYKVITWDLADGQDYGTGLVEDYAADFAGLSALSRSQIQGAILSSEFRWLVNPAGMTKVEDFEETTNGGALPGVEGDIHLIESGKGGDLNIVLQMTSEYINRIGRAFLLGSLLVRDAERVTAEEIRQTAEELETSLGGGYSRIAVDFQTPLARWLLESIEVKADENFQITIVTGLDALSRSGDLDDLKSWLADMAALNELPEPLMQTLRMDRIATALALPRRIDVSPYLKTPEEIQQEQAQMREQQATMLAAQAGATQAAKAKPTGA